jgi:diphosphomevalonate decarboxylase
MFGGFVAWEMGSQVDGSDSVAVEIARKEHWPEMQALIFVVSDAKKGTASSDGMQRTVATSPLLQHRIHHVVPERMKRMVKAIEEKDFTSFARETMKDSNSFHAVCLDTDPPIFYMNDVSKGIIGVVNEINRVSGQEGQGLIAAYTYDAGPNAVIYVLQRNTKAVLEILLRFFPQQKFEDVLGLNPELKGVKDLPKGFNENVSGGVFEMGSVVRIIHTEVGDGPRVLSADNSLLGVDGLPKSIK